MLPAQTLKEKPWASNPEAFWNVTNHWEYVFLDSAPYKGNIGPSSLSLYTNRTVKSTGTCKTPAYNLDIDTNSNIATIQLLDGSEGVVYFPAQAFQNMAVTYLTTPVLNEEETTSNCGPGCSNVKVIEMPIGPPVPGTFVQGSGSPVLNGSVSSYFFYDCNITVTSTDDSMTHGLSQINAAVAAQAIALTGQIPFPGDNNWVSYNEGLPFG